MMESAPLFETRIQEPAKNVFGRQFVIASEFRRRGLIIFTPLFAIAAHSLVSRWISSPVVPVVSDSVGGIYLAAIWPFVPVVMLGILISSIGAFVASFFERTATVRYRRLRMFGLAWLNWYELPLLICDERYPARIEAFDEHIRVFDNFEQAETANHSRVKLTREKGSSWRNFDYQDIKSIWVAPDYIVIRFLRDRNYRRQWYLIIDRQSFVVGDDKAFIKHIKPYVRAKSINEFKYFQRVPWPHKSR